MTRVPVELKKGVPAPRKGVEPFEAFRTEMDRLFDRFTQGFGLPSLGRIFETEPSWTAAAPFTGMGPAVDVTEDEKSYAITAELPGLDEKDVEVMVTDGALTIKGEKRDEKEEKVKNYYLAERSYGSFRRIFALPDGVDHQAVAANFAKGVLTVTLPKTAAAQKEAKKVEIKSAA